MNDSTASASTKPGLLSRLAASTGDAATTDSWFWRRWNIYGTEAACAAMISYILVAHLSSIHSVIGQFLGTGVGAATTTDSAEAEQIIWWSFALWATALLVHVFGPGAEKILLSFAQLIAAKFGVRLPENATMASTTTSSTVISSGAQVLPATGPLVPTTE